MWHEARRSEKKVHDMMDAARKRGQRRAVYLAKRRGDPLQSIQAIGSGCRLYRDDGLYQATQDQQGLIPWNGKQDILIDRFDGRALLDFIRDPGSRHFCAVEKTDEEDELEEFVNFERYRDLIKHRRRGFMDEDGLQHVNQEMETKAVTSIGFDRSHLTRVHASKGSYSQVAFSYDGNGKEETHYIDGDEEDKDEDDEDEENFNSDDSNDNETEQIAKEFGVKRYGWLVYMDKKAKDEERRQKEVVKGDPSFRKLSRKERRKASQIERERERDTARNTGTHHDPYRESRRSPCYDSSYRSRRSRSRSRSLTPLHSRRFTRGGYEDDMCKSKSRTHKIEYITEFRGSADGNSLQLQGYSPPPSPPSQFVGLSRPSSGRILEALHVDPASGVFIEKEKSAKILKTVESVPLASTKLSKTAGSSVLSKQVEKKETPQERLKRIMSKQLNKQIKKDTAAELAKKREQERQRLEKLAETSRLSRYRRRNRSRSYSRSPVRYKRSRSRSRSQTSCRQLSCSRSRSRSRSPSRSRSNSPIRYRR